MKLVKPGAEHEVPRGILGGSEISQATAGATNIYMARFRVPAGARSRPHYHANCESALYMLAGSIEIRWGEHLEQTLVVEPGDLLYVPPRETHIVVNRSDSEPADYVVARDFPTEHSAEVPWADRPAAPWRRRRCSRRSTSSTSRARTSRPRRRTSSRSSEASSSSRSRRW